MITQEFINEFKTKKYDEIVSLKEKKFDPTKEELKLLYSVNKIKIKHISKLYGWSNSNKISQLIDKYGFDKWHLDHDFKPKSKELFIEELKVKSVSELAREYNVDRSKISKYIKKNNLSIEYFNPISSLSHSDLIKELETDFIFNVASKYGVTPYELKRKLKVDNIDIFDIKLNESVIKNKLIEFVDTNPTYEGKTITHEKRLYNYVLKETKDHFLESDKVTERVYRIVNDYKHDQIDKCVHCSDNLKFYTTKLGYGNSNNGICIYCLPNYMSCGVSKVSQELFEQVFNELDFLDETNTKFSNLNGEFTLHIPDELKNEYTNKFYYNLDFKYKNKIIEFDGIYWHDNDDYENAKDDVLKIMEYDILHIKENDYYNNPQKEINKCIEFLKRE